MTDADGDGSPVVYSYDADLLADLMVSASDRADGETDNHFVKRKHHLTYLQGYLRKLGCATVIEEPGYIDRDFLEDFSAYHVRSFRTYRRICTRLHFFKQHLSQQDLEAAMLRREGAPGLQNSYLGFIVLRPLPVTVVGRTCLKTYTDQARRGTRLFPTKYRQDVDLHGIALHVESVAFQEQDKDVAACATSALWSVLQCTGRKFQHAIPSPVSITGTAAATGGYDERMLPAVAGLTIRQIADTLRYVGLEPHLLPLEVHKEEGDEAPDDRRENPQADGSDEGDGTISASSDADVDTIDRTRLEFKAAVAAYLRAGIPCLLLMRVTEASGREPERNVNHAVAVTGYRIGKGSAVPYGESGVMLEASRIDRIFVHDDQIGPFAKMKFEVDGTLEVSWPDGNGQSSKTLARSHTLVLPLDHKIRVPFGTILRLTLEIGSQLEGTRKKFPQFEQFVGNEPISWDIRLSSLRDLREDIARSDLPEDERKRLLEKRMPKHLWRILATVPGGAVLELLLDATDLVQGEMLVDIVVYAPGAALLLGVVFSHANSSFDSSPAHRRIRRGLKAFAPKQSGL